MDWPKTPVEYLANFQPPFCPWRECSEHLRREPGYLFRKHGYYSTKLRWRIPRFRCSTCKRTFSRQTFSTSYYRKRPELLRRVAAGLVAGSALRQIARSEECAPNTVARIAAHLGRHAILLHAHALAHLEGKLDEPVVFDHFETFEFTQDYPIGIATPVGARSWFVYDLDPAPHGRAGRRSEAQQRRLRSRPKRATRGHYAGSTTRILGSLLQTTGKHGTLVIRADNKPEYARAVDRHPARHRIALATYANPKRGPKGSKRSRAAIERDRAMFPIDLLHMILRHSLAHHRRETIAFPRRLNATMERLALTAVWRNFVKKRSERRGDSTSPAVELGLTDERWRWPRVLSRRLFFDRETPSATWASLYRREWETPLLRSNARHESVRAF